MKNNRLKLIKIFAFLLFAVMLFFNHGAIMGGMASQDMEMSHGESNQLMPCCDLKTPFSSMPHYLAVLNSSANDILKFIGFFGLLLFSLFIIERNKGAGSRYNNYTKRIRELYGSSRYFDYFLSLFRLGILHPKLF